MKNIANVNIDNLKFNISDFKENFSFKNYILNVSNNAFGHGIKLIKYLNDEFQYVYTNNFQDVLNIKKYNHKIKIIYSGSITEDNIYDLVLNDVIMVIKSKDTMDYILSLKIKDKFEIIFSIDKYDFNGFSSKHELNDILEDIKKDIHINILGVMAKFNEKDYLDFKYITEPLKNLELVILNNENDKNKIKGSNAILLDKSIYGIDTSKRKLFDKNISSLKPILEVNSYVSKIVKSINKKKEVWYAVVPLGLVDGINTNISKVFINDKFYSIKEINDEYIVVIVDNSINVNDIVEIFGPNNRLDYFIKDNIFNTINHITSIISINYEKSSKKLKS